MVVETVSGCDHCSLAGEKKTALAQCQALNDEVAALKNRIEQLEEELGGLFWRSNFT